MKTLVIVDDEPAIRMLLKQYFTGQYDIVTLDNGAQAVQWLSTATESPVIVLDLNMPELSGMEVIARVRASAVHAKAPVIVLSSKESSADRIACLKAGADDYVVKPFNPEELDVRIAAILRRM